MSFVAIVFDVIFAIALAFFSIAHWWMASKNQTSVEGYGSSHSFDLGWKRNFEIIFGKKKYSWFLPFYFNGPDGDGILYICIIFFIIIIIKYCNIYIYIIKVYIGN